MRDYIILTDSGSDLDAAKARELGVRVADLTVIKEGEEPIADSKMDIKGFYSFLREKKTATTSAVNVESFEEAMEEIIAEDKDILYIGFSSGLSVIIHIKYDKNVRVFLETTEQ